MPLISHGSYPKALNPQGSAPPGTLGVPQSSDSHGNHTKGCPVTPPFSSQAKVHLKSAFGEKRPTAPQNHDEKGQDRISARISGPGTSLCRSIQAKVSSGQQSRANSKWRRAHTEGESQEFRENWGFHLFAFLLSLGFAFLLSLTFIVSTEY